MPEQPLIEVPVQTTGIEEAYTSIGRFAQETTNQAETLASTMEGLINEGFEELAAIQAQITLKGSEDWKELQKAIADAKAELRGVSEETKRTGQTTTEETSRMIDWITKVPDNMMSKIPGRALLGGGLLALLLYGAGDTGRVVAEANQLAQVFEASSSRAVGSMAPVAEEFRALAAQMGLSREKITGVVELFARMGVPAERLVHDFQNVTTNIAGAATALDAFLERPFGTTAKDFITMMARYNLEGKELISTYTGIAMSARESGIGTERFMTSVFDASRALKTYGVDIGSVSNLLASMVSYNTQIGIPLEATLSGFSGIASGLSQLSDAWKATLGMDIMKMRGMQGATPMGGIMMMETGAMRAGQPGQEQFLVEMLQALNARMGRVGTNLDQQRQDEARYALLTRSMRFSPDAAAMLMEMFNTGRLEEIAISSKATPEELARLRNEMANERMKLSPWEQMSILLMEGLSQIARGTFGLLTTLLGTVMAGAGWLVGWAAEDPLLQKESIAAMRSIGVYLGESLGDIWGGLGQMGEGGKSMGGMMGLMGQMGTAFNESAQRYLDELEKQKQLDITPADPRLMPISAVPSEEDMGKYLKAYEEGRKVPAAAAPAERIKQLREGAGVDNLQGFIETKGASSVSITFNADELFAALISSPPANERVG